jgi:hypothetical protein
MSVGTHDDDVRVQPAGLVEYRGGGRSLDQQSFGIEAIGPKELRHGLKLLVLASQSIGTVVTNGSWACLETDEIRIRRCHMDQPKLGPQRRGKHLRLRKDRRTIGRKVVRYENVLHAL